MSPRATQRDGECGQSMMVDLCCSFFMLFPCCSVVSSQGTGESLFWCLEHVHPSVSSDLGVTGPHTFSLAPQRPFLKVFSPRHQHLWLKGRVGPSGPAGAGWNRPCPAQGGPSLPSQRPPCSPCCQRLGTCACYTALLHWFKTRWLQTHRTTNEFSEKCVVSCKRIHLAFVVLSHCLEIHAKKKPLSEFYSRGSSFCSTYFYNFWNFIF